MHKMKLPPLPLPPFYKEPTDGVLQSMLSHTVCFTMEYKWNQKKIKIKKEQPKNKKGKRLSFYSDDVRSFGKDYFSLEPFPCFLTASSATLIPLSGRKLSQTVPVTGRDLASFHKTHKQAGEMWDASRGNAALWRTKNFWLRRGTYKKGGPVPSTKHWEHLYINALLFSQAEKGGSHHLSLSLLGNCQRNRNTLPAS